MSGDGTKREGGDGGELAVVSSLIAWIAHDLNNLLMVMGSCAHFLESSPELGDAGRGDAALLNEAVQRAAADRPAIGFGRRRPARGRLDLGAGQ
jgi:hypothetical protein